MSQPYEKLARPEGTVQEVTKVTNIMTQRYRENQPAINKPSQDTVPDRDV